MSLEAVSPRAGGVACALALALAFMSPAGHAEPAGPAHPVLGPAMSIQDLDPARQGLEPMREGLEPMRQGPAAMGGPLAPDRPRGPLASPLIEIERIDGLGGAGGLAGPAGAPALEGEAAPTYLLDPDGFTTFGQVAPPDGGNLIMIVE